MNDVIETPDPATIRALVDQFSYDPDKVRTWTKAHANTVLRKCRREAKRVKAMAEQTAIEQAPLEARKLEPRDLGARMQGVQYLREQLAEGNPDGILIALTSAMYLFTFAEMQDYGLLLICQLKTNPDTGEPITDPWPLPDEIAEPEGEPAL